MGTTRKPEERVGLPGPERAVVQHPVGPRLARCDRERQQRAAQPLVRRALGPVGPVHHHVRVAAGDHLEPGQPGTAQEHRAEPVARQVERHPVAGVQSEVVGQHARGLRHPVGVRRHGQLGALAGDVVVERHEWPARVGAQPGHQHLLEGRQHAAHPRIDAHGGCGRAVVGSRPGGRCRHPALAPVAGGVAEVPARPHRHRAHAAAGHGRPAAPAGRRADPRGHRCRAPGRRTPPAARPGTRPGDRRAGAARLDGGDRAGRRHDRARRPDRDHRVVRRGPRDHGTRTPSGRWCGRRPRWPTPDCWSRSGSSRPGRRPASATSARATRLAGFPTARTVLEFVEKPDAERARAYVASGDYRWNAGMFVARATVLMDLLAEHRPELAAGLRAIASRPGVDRGPVAHAGEDRDRPRGRRAGRGGRSGGDGARALRLGRHR